MFDNHFDKPMYFIQDTLLDYSKWVEEPLHVFVVKEAVLLV